MLIATTTTLTFDRDDESEMELEFIKTNDVSEWQQYGTAQFSSYTKTQIIKIDKEEDNGHKA